MGHQVFGGSHLYVTGLLMNSPCQSHLNWLLSWNRAIQIGLDLKPPYDCGMRVLL